MMVMTAAAGKGWHLHASLSLPLPDIAALISASSPP
jgi:hypothetical protein